MERYDVSALRDFNSLGYRQVADTVMRNHETGFYSKLTYKYPLNSLFYGKVELFYDAERAKRPRTHNDFVGHSEVRRIPRYWRIALLVIVEGALIGLLLTYGAIGFNICAFVKGAARLIPFAGQAISDSITCEGAQVAATERRVTS